MANSHALVIQSALRTNDEIKTLFTKLGTTDAPRGRVLSAYRVARRALAGNLRRPDAVLDTLLELRQTVLESTQSILDDAAEMGTTQAKRELMVYGLQLGEGREDRAPVLIADANQVVLSALDAQLNGVRALALNGLASEDDPLILGDAERVGMLSPNPIIAAGALWVAHVALGAYTSTVQSATRDSGNEFKRQAIAAIDERTTDCCLQVQGQVVGLDEDFKLTGTPRFADELRNPPFHWWCRTATALVRAKDAGDDLTQEMRDAADAEMKARENTGTRQEINPAHARSTRAREGVGAVVRESGKTFPVPTPQIEALPPSELQWRWVHGSRDRTSVVLKEAAVAEFNLSGMVYKTRNYNITKNEIEATRKSAREMYEATQKHLHDQGITSVKLYRGIKSAYKQDGAIESWTSDHPTAVKFDGAAVLEMEIPIERILMFHEGPGWRNGEFGQQWEYVVMSDKPS